jgi:hypothetical protein
VAEHGFWNRRIRSGYQVVFIPFSDGLRRVNRSLSFRDSCLIPLAGKFTGAWLALLSLTTVLF